MPDRRPVRGRPDPDHRPPSPPIYASDDGHDDDAAFMTQVEALDPATRWLVVDAARLSRLAGDRHWLERRGVLEALGIVILVRGDLECALEADGIEIVDRGRRAEAARRLLGPERWIAVTPGPGPGAPPDPMLVDVVVSTDPPGVTDRVWWVRVESTGSGRPSAPDSRAEATGAGVARPDTPDARPATRVHGVFRWLRHAGEEGGGSG